MELPVRIGVVDSGFAIEQSARVVASAAFVAVEGGVRRVPAKTDMLGHGSQVVEVLLHYLPPVELFVAQVFRERLTSTPAQVAAAIDWLVDSGVQLINLSLGLREPRPVLAAACAHAQGAGVMLCAATPARGGVVYPSGFPGVVRVTGDARCDVMEIAALKAIHADFGANVRPIGGSLTGAGASMACAHLTGVAGRYLAAGGAVVSLVDSLMAQAHYTGMEDPRSRRSDS